MATLINVVFKTIVHSELLSQLSASSLNAILILPGLFTGNNNSYFWSPILRIE